MATTPELHEPQIAAARAQAWRQTGDPLLTLEAARSWLESFGLVAFAPLASVLGAPGPSLVEATLGSTRQSTTIADAGVARSLTARLVGEGSALPLNLLGGPGDVPDFLVTTPVFPFVFTLRGDKGWKRPPETSGSVKVTPLGLRVYEVLAEKGALPIAEIVSEIGREVTESAVGRALSELWQLLRVIPVLQQGEGPTVWELTTSRFLKAVKAGANAGQPTALSGLVSFYLAQALVATEEEVASFLSPLTARSRVREVLHGLAAARELAEGVVQGKTVVYVPEMLPDFAAFATGKENEAEEPASGSPDVPLEGTERPASDRIRRFGAGGGPAKDRPLRGKPVRRPEDAERASRQGAPRREGFGAGPGGERRPREGAGERRSFSPRGDRPPRRDGGGDRKDRPATGERRPPANRAPYARPWDEERANRPPRRAESGEAAPRDREERRPPRAREGAPNDRPPFRRREGPAGGKERGAGEFKQRSGEGAKRFQPRDGSERAPRPFRPRGEQESRPFRPRPAGEGRPFQRRPEGEGRPFRQRTEGEGRPFQRRTEGEGRPFRSPAEGSDRPKRGPAGDRPAFPARERGGDRPFRPRERAGERAGGFAPRREPGGAAGARPGGGKFRGSRSEAGGAPERPRSGSYGDRPQRREGSAEGRAGAGSGDRRPPRPGGAGGGFRPGVKRAGFKKPGGKSSGRPDRAGAPARPPRRPEPGEEA